MEVYLPPDESELFKYVCLDQKVLFQIMKGVQAFIFEQPCPCSSLPAGLLPLCSQSTFPFQVLSCSGAFAGVSSLLPPTGIEGNEPFHHRLGANFWNQWKSFLPLALLGVSLPTPRLPPFKGIKSSFRVSPFWIPNKRGMARACPLFLCFWPAQFLYDLVPQNWGHLIQGNVNNWKSGLGKDSLRWVSQPWLP